MARFDTHSSGRLDHPPTVLLLALSAQLGIHFLPLHGASIPTVLRVTGGLFILAGVALNVLASRLFDHHRTPIRPGARSTALMTEGPFAQSRNPMHLGMALIVAGTGLVLGEGWALVVLPLFVGWLDRLVRWEETLLEQAFGERYHAYRRRVRRWL